MAIHVIKRYLSDLQKEGIPGIRATIHELKADIQKHDIPGIKKDLSDLQKEGIYMMRSMTGIKRSKRRQS